MNPFSSYLSNDDTQHSLLSMYSWLGIGLFVTAFTSFFMYSSGTFLHMIYSAPMVSWILIIIQFGVAMAFSGLIQKVSAAALKGLYLVYAVTLGISLTSLAYTYALGVIAVAFLVTSVYFGCLVFIGKTTKKDLSKLGTICFAGLIAMIICELVMMLFKVSFMTQVISIIGLLIFTGLTAYDVQRAERLMTSGNGTLVSSDKMAIYMAFQLYLDFINIFLYIVRILGRNND